MIDQASIALVRLALAEDLAGYGDITSQWTVPADLAGRGVITAREELVVCGLPLAAAVMAEVDSRAVFTLLVGDGASVAAGERLAVIEGPARGLLSAERTMLNFLIHLCGVATQSRRFYRAVEGTGVTVVDTRKTIPGLRAWQKRAVVYGGCGNHRFGLFDMVLVKNNHLEAAGGVRAAMDRVKAAGARYVKVEVEVESEADLREAVACGADVIMLDNQDLESLRGMVSIARALRPGLLLEASGRVSLSSVRAVAETGVDLISTSALTMGAPPVDLSLTLTVGS
ncbi:MAG: nicotinate-nucleotide diphosphorylase (carboxylating) [Actinobacteria bacterium RBG_16_64_13]|nr:MAG: nicotinate-nucleotide diphosphorylase (carboxylating) [Actinobacteria bacterium RBG_16_64_13]